ncbi:hypothetical protein ACXZ1K_18190 [Pedobacter sp. PWIIR3]
MGYAKERAKLEKLINKLDVIHTYDQKNMAILEDVQENYSHTVRILKNKAPELFLSLYKNELQAVKDGKIAVKESVEEEPRQSNFIRYKEALFSALTETIIVTNQTV